jgi:hypothetical protein|tara:strand:- start:1359 stop:1616 length:258 start_codon:yes stop_codon:yes gene_type:complete
MSQSPEDYRKFYKPQNRKLLSPVVGDPDGYVTKDGQWAAVPFGNSDAKLAIINNGKVVHTARNYSSALTYIKKQISAGKKRRKKK